MRHRLWLLPLLAFASGCSRTRSVAAEPAPSHVDARFSSQTRGCSDSLTVGDTVYALLESGGERLSPPLAPGTRAAFLVTASVPGTIPPGAGPEGSGARFGLEPRLAFTAAGPRPLTGGPVMIEWKIYVPPGTNRLYLCVAHGSAILIDPPVLD